MTLTLHAGGSNEAFAVQGERADRVHLRILSTFAALLVLFGPAPLVAQEWAATLQVRAGAMEGPGSLSSVFQARLGKNGEILAVQPTVPTISVFDPTGRFLRNVGRAGGGPGEFGVPSALGWTGDTLWVMDVGQSRVHLFDRDLAFARTITPVITDLPPGAMRLLPGPFLADGSIMAIPVMAGPAGSHPLILLGEDGSTRRALPPIDHRGQVVQVRRGGGQFTEVTNPWADTPLWTPAADGRSILIVHRPVATEEDEGRLTIVRLALDGDTLVDREFTYRPKALTTGETDRTFREIAERLARNPILSTTPAQAEADVRASLSAPRYHPPVTKLISGADGTIWLKREAPAGGREEWQVLSAEGEMLGRVRLPAELEVHGADLARVWGVTQDDLDVSFVEVYGVRRDGAR